MVETAYEGTPRHVRVIVYETLKGLRGAAARHDNQTRSRRKRHRGEFADTLGVCHRFELQDHAGESRPWAREYSGIGIVSHELAHAVVWMRELHHGHGMAPLTCADDEPFAWTLGDLVRLTVAALYEHKVWPDDDA